MYLYTFKTALGLEIVLGEFKNDAAAENKCKDIKKNGSTFMVGYIRVSFVEGPFRKSAVTKHTEPLAPGTIYSETVSA